MVHIYRQKTDQDKNCYITWKKLKEDYCKRPINAGVGEFKDHRKYLSLELSFE